MAGSGNVGKLLICGMICILIAEEELEGSTRGQTALHAPDDLRDVRLRAGGSTLAAGTTAVDVLREVSCAQRDTLRPTDMRGLWDSPARAILNVFPKALRISYRATGEWNRKA